MKKIFALTLVILLCLSIAACKNNDDAKDGAVTTDASTTTEATTKATTTGATTTAAGDYDPSDPSVDDIF